MHALGLSKLTIQYLYFLYKFDVCQIASFSPLVKVNINRNFEAHMLSISTDKNANTLPYAIIIKKAVIH
jgi:hypothetical protein